MGAVEELETPQLKRNLVAEFTRILCISAWCWTQNAGEMADRTGTRGSEYNWHAFSRVMPYKFLWFWIEAESLLLSLQRRALMGDRMAVGHGPDSVQHYRITLPDPGYLSRCASEMLSVLGGFNGACAKDYSSPRSYAL